MRNQCKFRIAALIAALAYLTGTVVYGDYICGDANYDETVNIADAVWIINYIFAGGDPPIPIEAGDANCDKTCNVADAVWIINYIFAGGDEPCDTDGDGIPECDADWPWLDDIDGNRYYTIKICDRWWMMENLKVTHYNNGDPIPNVTDSNEWAYLETGAYCNYDNDSANAAVYGRLYNWYAVDDSRNIAPEGWHVPSDSEWKQLEMCLGMSQAEADTTGWRGTDEGGMLKEAGTTHWNPPNTGATNESGFAALPGGYRYTIGSFNGMGYDATFWSFMEQSSYSAWGRSLNFTYSQISRYYADKHHGFSVRCVKDYTGTVTDIDGNTYQTIKIGDQWWMAENLKVTHYRNGDPIPNVTDSTEWTNLTTCAYCEYDNDSANVDTYGRLYNWYAVDDSRNVAPEGWHVPNDAEWKQLEMYLGMSQAEADASGLRGNDEGGKLKEAGMTHWNPPNTGATNESGFTALPGGSRTYNCRFLGMGNVILFWTSTEHIGFGARYRSLHYDYSQVNRSNEAKRSGFSIRCVKD